MHGRTDMVKTGQEYTQTMEMPAHFDKASSIIL